MQASRSAGWVTPAATQIAFALAYAAMERPPVVTIADGKLRSVNLAVDNDVGNPGAIREIEKVPFLMIYRF